MTNHATKFTKTLSALFAVILWGGLAGLARAGDDALVKLNSTGGSSDFAIQDQNGVYLMTANSAGVVSISSNTIMPGTTVYQDGDITIGGSGHRVSFYGASLAAGGVHATGSTIQQWLLDLGFYSGTGSLPLNTGTGTLTVGAAATSLGAGGLTVSAAGAMTTTQLTTLSSTTLNGYIAPYSRQRLQILAIVPGAAGQIYYCSDCTTAAVCISTGAAAGQMANIGNRTTACN
jgi:hypothetical protein